MEFIRWLTLLYCLVPTNTAQPPHTPVIYLNPGDTISSVDVLSSGGELAVFCYAGTAPQLTSLWRSVHLHIHAGDDAFALYRAANASAVLEQWAAATAQLLPVLPWRERHVRMPPFAPCCVGVAPEPSRPFTVGLILRHVDYWLVGQAAVGVALFVTAPQLSASAGFHYSAAAAMGVLAALLVAVFLLSRLVPRRGAAAAVLLTGWSVSLYVLQRAAEDIQLLLIKHRSLALGYVAVSGALGFAVCYWRGPVRAQRGQDLLRWLLQTLGLGLLYLSCSQPEPAAALCLLLVAHRCTPAGVWTAVRRHLWWCRLKPRRLLTEQEYLEQSAAATRVALMELRQFCRSPDCDAWRTVSRLKSPQRFADFVEGGSHLSDDELLEYELESDLPLLTEDEDAGGTSADEDLSPLNLTETADERRQRRLRSRTGLESFLENNSR